MRFKLKFKSHFLFYFSSFFSTITVSFATTFESFFIDLESKIKFIISPRANRSNKPDYNESYHRH